MKEFNKIGPFTKLACLLIGWNLAILKECGEASHRTLKKYVSAILILSVIWGAIGYCFADRYIGMESTWGKVIVSAIFIIIIICIERFIILMVGKLGWVGFMRFFLAFLMAVLGSAVFDQIIFKNDVDVKMKEVRTRQINEEIPRRNAFLDVDIQKVTLLIDSIGAENIKLYETLAKKPVIASTDVNTITKQTGIDENGNPIIEKTTSVTKKNIENPLNGQIKANENALKMYQEQLAMYQLEKMSVADKIREEYDKAHTGFLEELKALFDILKSDTYALVFYLFLFLFLMSLELLVVLSKREKPCDYDLIVEHQLKLKSETLKRTEDNLLNKR